MDCCGQAPRHWMWSTALTSVGAMLAGDVGPRGSTTAARTAETASAALEVLRKSISVDVHSHGGRTGITSKAPPNDDLVNAMRAGSLAIACLADVPDGPILARDAEGVLAATRTPEPGELYRHHLERLGWMDEMVTNHGDTSRCHPSPTTGHMGPYHGGSTGLSLGVDVDGCAARSPLPISRWRTPLGSRP